LEPFLLDALEQRVGRTPGAMVVVDRGMAFADTLQQITARGYHYLVASRPGERNDHLDDFEAAAGWQEIVREPSPTNPGQRKTRVVVRRKVVRDEVHILCRSDGREAKDRAIREKHEQRLLAALRATHLPPLGAPGADAHLPLRAGLPPAGLDREGVPGAGIHTSWATLREELTTHQVVTVVLPASNGDVLKIRQGSTPEPRHKAIYTTLQIPAEVMTPGRTWVRAIVTE
jgi:hypothetical protein